MKVPWSKCRVPKKDRNNLVKNPNIKTYTILGMKKFLAFSFILVFIVYLLTSGGKTPYDYFTRLSDSFLHGKIYLEENPSWLSELITIGNNKFTFVNPPMPAVIIAPFRFFFGTNFEQQYMAHIVGAGITVLMMLISWKVSKNKKITIWTGLLTAFGNIIWFLSSTGSVWYLGQITATFFIAAMLLEYIDKKRPLVVGFLLSAALLSRLQLLPSLILFTYLLKPKFDKKGVLKIMIALSFFVILYSLYNYFRFGRPWETGYTLIPGILDEPWFKYGQFSFSYIPKHLKIFLLGLPIFTNHVPYIFPSWAGMSIWITTPAFVFAFCANIKEKIVKQLWVVILLIALINFSYGSTGFSQFGYRYAVDFYPFLLFLTIKGATKTGLRWYHWFLLFLSVVVNLWGVIWINKFGWVSF